ncbi:zinc finger protein 335-like [Anopheles cruzii]|uniref:zinc finger protein 335-like n=1 Tax=Anopheles cruzii TaxID=68878 RepID=UPI0022EC7388|nr:zinc finger protein 335-like [Anopheles cruzii]
MDVAPSMVQRSGDKLIVRRVVSGEQVHLGESSDNEGSERGADPRRLPQSGWRQTYDDPFGAGSSSSPTPPTDGAATAAQDEQQLPQCKIKRNYSCGRCTYFTQNPRKYLTHLRDTHGEKIVINECKRCLYASRHYQKLVRHMKMVHGSVDGIKKSSFGASGRHRNRLQRPDFTGGGTRTTLSEVLQAAAAAASHGGPGASSQRLLLRRGDPDTDLAAAYVQQLVAAAGLPKLLEEIEKSAASSSVMAAANYARIEQRQQDEQSAGNQPLPYETVQEASPENGTPAGEDPDSLKPKKRPRPIPNLIPLAVSPATAAPAATTSTTKGRFVKPLPLSALTADTRPVEDSKPNPSMTAASDSPVLTRCVYCELSFKTVEALANHIKLAHKEDLIAALLQSSFEEAEPRVLPVNRPADGAAAGNAVCSADMWQRLLECSAEVRRIELERAGGGSQTAAAQTPSAVDADGDDDGSGREGDEPPAQSQTFCGIETAPGYGEVTNRVPADPGTSTALMKKVFKCPHCSFWASTASRFHVHIVGHLNKKPFECSLCAYRSNWRWDITKHIRLKTIRDPNHKNAGVLMNDETGRRNYTKYNRYMALMQITDK